MLGGVCNKNGGRAMLSLYGRIGLSVLFVLWIFLSQVGAVEDNQTSPRLSDEKKMEVFVTEWKENDAT